MADKLMENFEPSAEMLAQAQKLKVPKPSDQLKLPRSYMSHSQVDMYLRCPRQYYFRYVKDESQPPGIAMTLGTSVHGAVETTHHHLVDHGVPAPHELVLDRFSDVFEGSYKDIPDQDWQDEELTPGGVKDTGVALVKLYNTKMAPLVRPQVTKDAEGKEVRGIEKKFTVDVAGVPMLGYIDLIDTNDASLVLTPEELALYENEGREVPEAMRTVIADFKTKAKSFSQGDVDGSMQLTLYSYVENVPAVRFDQLLRQKTPKVKRVNAVRKPHDYEWMKVVVRSVAEAISAGIFPPCSPTEWACTPKWCGFYSLCRGRKL